MNYYNKKPEEEGAPHWTLSFSDMATLLLVFFVFMVAYSTRKNERPFYKAVNSFRKAIESAPKSIKLTEEPTKREKLLKKLESVINKAIKQAGIMEGIKVFPIKEGILIVIPSLTMFPKGSAELKHEAEPVLSAIANVIKKEPLDVRVEGHTCDLPIHTKEFASNWELSSQRAINVVRFFIGKGVDRRRLQAVAFADTRPVRPNTNEENRRRNRRVEIKIIYPE